ncbi:MAG TPA: mechanosensitive ion channel domain-containing protein [Pyrinomonadaceae bacterium]|nr:mechanosensitive ion channel domain-containing protein [Pyrinomonadaceae bacterium]
MFLSQTFIKLLLSLALAWQDTSGVVRRVWEYINHKFSFGNIQISLSSLVIGVIVLILTLTVGRSASTLLDRRLAKRSHIDPGLRYTIARLVNYIVVTVGILIALKQAFSIDLTSIAVVFTALSVGIGFGLQYIAADIAAGFILLFERPVRVGDRITIGEDEGDVQSINLRTTIVSTNDRIAIIVPNSKLVSQRVINWSYGDPRARISIPIGVATNSDVKLVTETLLAAAQGIENVLSEPQPKVQFLRFGDYSLDFRLLIWTRQPNRHAQIKSDINYRIETLFRERGIEIPYPTQQFLFKGTEPPPPTELSPAQVLDGPGESRRKPADTETPPTN